MKLIDNRINTLNYDITTSECIFRDISQFYQPMCYDTNKKYVNTLADSKLMVKPKNIHWLRKV